MEATTLRSGTDDAFAIATSVVDILKFLTLVACQEVLDIQWRPRSSCLKKQSD